MARQQYTEQELINGCRKGKKNFQELLYKQFYGFGMSVCLRYTYSREDALEVLNDGFMKVFNNINVFDPDKPFKSWFRKILVNTALDQYRTNKKYRIQVPLDDLEIPENDLIAPEYEEQSHAELSADHILGMFDRLPDIYRLTFNLYEVEGYSHDEIAGMLGISPGTSRSNLSRAKKMLRTIYHTHQNTKRNEAV